MKGRGTIIRSTIVSLLPCHPGSSYILRAEKAKQILIKIGPNLDRARITANIKTAIRWSFIFAPNFEVPRRLPSAPTNVAPAHRRPLNSGPSRSALRFAQAPPVICRFGGLENISSRKTGRPSSGRFHLTLHRSRVKLASPSTQQKNRLPAVFCAVRAFAKPLTYNFRTIFCWISKD